MTIAYAKVVATINLAHAINRAHEIGSLEPRKRADMSPPDVVLALDVSADIMVRSGHHYTLPLTKEIIRKPGTVQAFAYFYNKMEQIEKLVLAVGGNG